MASTTFKIERPEQLREMEEKKLCKTGSVASVEKVWRLARRQKERTAWDDKIFACFETEGRERRAKVYRISMGAEKVIAWLKYTPALNWCIANLQQIRSK